MRPRERKKQPKAGDGQPTGIKPTRNGAHSAKRHNSDTDRTPSSGLVVGIGASAGGLEAFKTFFTAMPSDSGMAFVLVQHLSPDHKSLMAELLGKTTAMPVMQAEDGMRIAGNRVYVIPPDATLTIEDRVLRVVVPAPPREHRRPIDTFFSSLAEDQGESAVCIVLSGTGSDGTRSLSVVKEHGGLTLAQAAFDHAAMIGMPHSAAATGLVDEVMPVEAMPARLVDYQQHLSRVAERKGGDGTRTDTAAHLATISTLLRAKLGHDFSQYKEKTLVRRIQRRMQVLQIDTVPGYIARLRQEPHELELLFRELLIGVTQFFRDPKAFEALQAMVIPKLVQDKRAGDSLRIWVPGCATGEEVYSIAILVQEELERRGEDLKVQIFGTDIDDSAIATARAGRYRKPLAGVSPDRVERWFTEEGDECCPIKTIRDMCVFSTHSLVKDPPFSKLDLISCRNLLIYLDAALQDRVVRAFHYALRPGGVLFLGSAEGLSRNARLFTALDKKHRIFQRRDVDVGLPELSPSAGTRAPMPSPAVRAAHPGEDRIDRSVRRALERYSPVYVVIDQHHEIVRFSGGEAGPYLEPSPGRASLDLFGILRKPLRPVVRAAVDRVATERELVVHDDVALKIEGRGRAVRVIVAPLTEGETDAGMCVVAFQDVGQLASREGAKSADRKADANLRALEQELHTMKAQLQATIDEFETVNEEMKSANEEYQAVNEELQSSNEELETSKEEMQSINEELQTINAEMGSKNELLRRLNSDLKNLLDSTEIATIFLDGNLRIKSFTPGMTDIFHVRDTDRGRPITEIVTLLSYGDLQGDVKRVMRNLIVVEQEVGIPGSGAAFIMRIRPYRTVDNVLDGVVITFVDISERKTATDVLRQHSAIVEFAQDALIAFNFDGIVRSWNPAAERLLGYSASEAIGRHLSMLVSAGLAQEQTDLIAQARAGEFAGPVETVRRRHDGSEVAVEMTIVPIRAENGEVMSLSVALRDITERKAAERQTALLLGELDHRVKNILAVVSAVIMQTLKTSPSPAAFAAAMEGRITAIARAHSLLTREGGRGEVSLRDLIATELAPHDRKDGTLVIDGASLDIALTPKAGLALAMAIHELASNAAKYGALSTSTGHLTITWTIADRGGSRALNLAWVETGGPTTQPPSRSGFGTKLIERTLTHELDAAVNREFPASGLRCFIQIPLTDEVGHVRISDRDKGDLS